jgi:hypothetical protein
VLSSVALDLYLMRSFAVLLQRLQAVRCCNCAAAGYKCMGGQSRHIHGTLSVSELNSKQQRTVNTTSYCTLNKPAMCDGR